MPQKIKWTFDVGARLHQDNHGDDHELLVGDRADGSFNAFVAHIGTNDTLWNPETNYRNLSAAKREAMAALKRNLKESQAADWRAPCPEDAASAKATEPEQGHTADEPRSGSSLWLREPVSCSHLPLRPHVHACCAELLGRVDGFDQDEAHRESDEGCEVSHCLLAS